MMVLKLKGVLNNHWIGNIGIENNHGIGTLWIPNKHID